MIIRKTLSAALLSCALATPAFSNDDFGGSFGGSEPAAQDDGQTAGGGDQFGGSFGEGSPGGGDGGGDSGGGDFGGSFGDGQDAGGTSDVVVTTPDVGDSGDAGGGDDFGGGSFDEDTAGPGPDEGGSSEITEVTPDTRPDDTTGPGGPGGDGGIRVDGGVTAFETRDFGVPPTNRLRSSQFHSPTPTAIPGGQMVTTGQLANAINSGQALVIIDVLGSNYSLPNAFQAPAMATPGSYRDRIQQQTNQWLRQVTRGNAQIPLVVLCSNPQCWLSYNAGLRAIAAGYKNVFWYRGGHQAWSMAGFPLVPSAF